MFICLSHTLYTLHFVYEHVILLRGVKKKKRHVNLYIAGSFSGFQPYNCFTSNRVHTFLHNVESVEILKKCGYCVK